MSSRQAMQRRGPDHPQSRRDAAPAKMVSGRRQEAAQPDEGATRPERRYQPRARGRKRGSLFSRKWSKETSEWVFAGVVFVVLILGVVLGIHFIGGTSSTAATGRRPSGGSSGFGGGQNGAVVSAVAGALGISTTTLTSDLQAGQSLPQIAAAQNVSITTVNNAYLAAVKQTFDSAVSSGRFTQSQADQLYSIQQQDVANGQYPLLRVFGGAAATATS